MRKTLRISGNNEIGKSVEKSLDEYFTAGGNQTQAADMLGLNRSTLRTKLTKYGIR